MQTWKAGNRFSRVVQPAKHSFRMIKIKRQYDLSGLKSLYSFWKRRRMW